MSRGVCLSCIEGCFIVVACCACVREVVERRDEEDSHVWFFKHKMDDF